MSQICRSVPIREFQGTSGITREPNICDRSTFTFRTRARDVAHSLRDVGIGNVVSTNELSVHRDPRPPTCSVLGRSIHAGRASRRCLAHFCGRDAVTQFAQDTTRLVGFHLQPRADCPVCRGSGWVCEHHPNLQAPHDQCRGPEAPCEADGCLSDWFRSQGLN
jgi:hypothetical protein